MSNYPDEYCPEPFVTKKPDCIDIGSGVVPLDNVFKFNDGLRVVNKSKNINERQNYSKWYKEQINMFGTEVLYQSATEDLQNYDPLYGEDSDQTFGTETCMIMYIELNENALTLSQFGITSDDEVTAYIHIDNFYSAMGGTGDAKQGVIEPKAGDIFSFNNRRVLHGRKEYDANSGERHLQGYYIDRDEIIGRLNFLNKINP